VSAAGAWTYTPAPNHHGADAFSFAVSDGRGGSATYTVSVTVAEVNDAPAAADASVAATEDTPASGQLPAAADADGDPVAYALAGQAAHGTATVSASGAWTYAPAANYHGPDAFSYTASDGRGGSTTRTVGVTVAEVNDRPEAGPLSIATDEDAAVDGRLPAAVDADGEAVHYALAAPAAHGSASVAPDGTFRYTPEADWSGRDAFAFRVSDGRGGSATYTVSVTVRAVNDAPGAADAEVSTDEDTPLAGRLPAAIDADGSGVEYALAAAPAHGSATVSAAGHFTYRPAPDVAGTDAFDYRVDDGSGGTATHTVTVTVRPVNDAPVAANAEAATDEDTPLAGRLPAATDADGDALAYALASAPAHGTAGVTADGRFEYRPDPDFAGTDRFEYRVDDGHGGTATHRVDVTVRAVDDTVAGGPGDDRLADASGPAWLLGLGGDDTLDGGSGDDTIDGGPGTDTAVYARPLAQYIVSGEAPGSAPGPAAATVRALAAAGDAGQPPEGTDRLVSVERLLFADTGLALDTGGAAGTAWALWHAIAQRAPTPAEFAHWVDALDHGASPEQAAATMIGALAPQATHAELVARLFPFATGRAATETEVALFAAALDAGEASAGELAALAASLGLARPETAAQLAQGLRFAPGEHRTAAGTDGDDTLAGSDAPDLLIGLGGLDTARLDGARAAHSVSLADGIATVTGPGGTDTLAGIERVAFDDGAIAFDVDGSAGEAFALWWTLVHRAPAPSEIGRWIADLDASASTSATAANMLAALAPGIGDRALVERLYAHLVGTAPDPATADGFVAMIASGQVTQAGLLVLAAEAGGIARSQYAELVAQGIDYFWPAA
nr:Ig-like domain-containing protein [Vicinamibacterales bacterium]